MDWTLASVIFFPALFGGFFQTVAGFGSGILLMMILPAFLPILQAAAISSITAIYLTGTLALSLRDHVDWRSIWLPGLIFLAVSGTAIHIAPYIDTKVLGVIFGLFLMSLALWFFMEGRQKRRFRITPARAVGISALTGVTSGWFGLSGPPMAIYFLATCGEDKKRYLATTQAFFFGVVVFNSIVRVAEGILTYEMLILSIWGIAGMILGKKLGLILFNRINLKGMRTIIHCGLAVSGLLTVVKNLAE